MDCKTRDLVMGKLYLKNKDYKMAEKSFLDYLNLNPEDYQALKMLAQVYENMNNHQRAFEFYERSYLVDTQRKGTLLDICRLLLIEGSGLDHVDRKKWLKLAVQAFPTNPIVTNLRDTLPALESNHAPNKINLESELMSKMDRLEERLTSIEHLLARLAVSKDVEPRAEQPKAVQLKVEQAKVEEPKVEQPKFQQPKVEQPKFEQPKFEQPKVEQPKFELPKFELPKFEQPKFRLPKVEQPKFQLPKFEQPKVEQPKFELPKVEQPKVEQPKFELPKVEQPKADQPKAEEAKAPTELKSTFKAFTFGHESTNYFADSLKKLNLPEEGSWTTTPAKPFSFNLEQSNEATETKKDQEKGGDEEGNETVDAPELPIENTCDMQPIEIKSGEEDEDVVFEHRCKLFRFRDKEYKERGLGNIKVLKHRTTNAGRLIMRRDLINLVCLNCWSCSKIERVRDTQVRFAGLDASDGEPVMTVFLAKFKTQELTDTFISHLNELFHEESE